MQYLADIISCCKVIKAQLKQVFTTKDNTKAQ